MQTEPRFCDKNCHWLSPTEAEQSQQEMKAPHRCGKFGKELTHREHHPHIVRLAECDTRYWCLVHQQWESAGDDVNIPNMFIDNERYMSGRRTFCV